MRKKAIDTKRQIIDAAYTQFYKGGFARTGVDAIAEAAGITKRTLYQHFDSKGTLVAAVLEAQNELMLTRIQDWADHAAHDAESMVQSLFAGLNAWAKQRRWRGSGFTRAAMEFADLPGHPARVAARKHKAAVEDWLVRKFADYEITTSRQLAQEVMLLIEGCHSLVLIHGDVSYIDRASVAARLLVRREVDPR